MLPTREKDRTNLTRKEIKKEGEEDDDEGQNDREERHHSTVHKPYEILIMALFAGGL